MPRRPGTPGIFRKIRAKRTLENDREPSEPLNDKLVANVMRAKKADPAGWHQTDVSPTEEPTKDLASMNGAADSHSIAWRQLRCDAE